jgi:hypothetical protein
VPSPRTAVHRTTIFNTPFSSPALTTLGLPSVRNLKEHSNTRPVHVLNQHFSSLSTLPSSDVLSPFKLTALRLLHITFCKGPGRSDRRRLLRGQLLRDWKSSACHCANVPFYPPGSGRRMTDIYRVSYLPLFQNTPDPQVFSLPWQGVNSEFFWCCLANLRTTSTVLT